MAAQHFAFLSLFDLTRDCHADPEGICCFSSLKMDSRDAKRLQEVILTRVTETKQGILAVIHCDIPTIIARSLLILLSGRSKSIPSALTHETFSHPLSWKDMQEILGLHLTPIHIGVIYDIESLQVLTHNH